MLRTRDSGNRAAIRSLEAEMYRSDLKSRDKGSAVAAVIAVHAGLLFALLHLSGEDQSGRSAKRVAGLRHHRKLRPLLQPKPQRATSEKQKPKEREGPGSAKNLRARRRRSSHPSRGCNCRSRCPSTRTNTQPGRRTNARRLQHRRSGNGCRRYGTGTGSGTREWDRWRRQGLADSTRLATRPLRSRDYSAAMFDARPHGASLRNRFTGRAERATSNAKSIRRAASRR